jgi:hypothetical protein
LGQRCSSGRSNARGLGDDDDDDNNNTKMTRLEEERAQVAYLL